jgi:hypothetical protein
LQLSVNQFKFLPQIIRTEQTDIVTYLHFRGGDRLKFGDIVTAVASAALILLILIFPMDMVLIPALGFYWGLNVGAIISVLLTALIVGYVFAGKISESRIESITKIAVLSGVLMVFLVGIQAAATDWKTVVTDAYKGESHTAFEWYVLEAVALSGQMLINAVIVLVLGFIGLYVGSMVRKPKKS